jgi:hypothetical protein
MEEAGKVTMSSIYGAGKYKHGLCHVFALALHHVFGYRIAILEDRDRELVRDHLRKAWPYIPHVFCTKGGYIIDAVGVRKASTMIRQTGKFRITHPKIHYIDPRSLYNNSLYTTNFERITKKDLKEAEEFIYRSGVMRGTGRPLPLGRG